MAAMYAIAGAEYGEEFNRIHDELQRERQRGRDGAARTYRIGIALSAVLAVLLLAFGGSLAASAILLLIVLTPLWAIVMLCIQHYDDVADGADSTMRLLERERIDTEALVAFAFSGAPFALFLRSFASEAEGLGARGLRTMIELDARQARIRNRYDDFGDTGSMIHFEAHAKWTSEIAVVGALAGHLPVVLLGNLRLSADMTADLERLGVRSLTIQAQDWYAIFEALAARARLVLFYVEQVSPSLKREIVYAGASQLDYVILGAARDVAEIAASYEGGAAFVSAAKAVIAPDHPDIPGALRGVISGLAA